MKAPKVLQKRERSVKKQVNGLIEPYDDQIWRYMAPASRFGMPALDFLLCVRGDGAFLDVVGEFVAVETKRPSKKPTPRQWETIQALRAAGAKVLVVRDNEGLSFLSALLESIVLQMPANAKRIYDCYLTWEASLGFGGTPAPARPRRNRRAAVPQLPASAGISSGAA